MRLACNGLLGSFPRQPPGLKSYCLHTKLRKAPRDITWECLIRARMGDEGFWSDMAPAVGLVCAIGV